MFAAEHCNMIRGLVPAERLLEWSVEGGWEPLCKFLGKEVPDEPFPRTNGAAGFEVRKDKLLKQWSVVAFRNMAVAAGVCVAASAAASKMYY